MTRVDRSYSPYKEVREYQDRGMMKWQGFYLSEHTTAMEADKAPKKYFTIKVIGYLMTNLQFKCNNNNKIKKDP